MIAFLISLAPFIPIILQIAGILIKWFGTSEENLKAYADMVQKNKDAGLITVDTARKLQGYHDEMRNKKTR
jgi:predicted MPP superfamily phosphohydrolase